SRGKTVLHFLSAQKYTYPAKSLEPPVTEQATAAGQSAGNVTPFSELPIRMCLKNRFLPPQADASVIGGRFELRKNRLEKLAQIEKTCVADRRHISRRCAMWNKSDAHVVGQAGEVVWRDLKYGIARSRTARRIAMQLGGGEQLLPVGVEGV